MKTRQKNRVLGVITYAAADAMCKDKIENWMKYTQADEVLFSGADQEFWSPDNAYKISVGEDRYPKYENPNDVDLNLPLRLTETLAKSIELAEDPENAEIILIEPDVWFWDYIPLNDGFTGCRINDWSGKYWHWPYIICGKNNANKLLGICKTLIKHKALSYPWGSYPDRFIALALALSEIKATAGNQHSRNTILKKHLNKCKTARQNGAFAVHGIKSWSGLECLR